MSREESTATQMPTLLAWMDRRIIRTHTVHAAALGTLSLHLDALSCICMALQTSDRDRNSSSTMEVEYVAFSTQHARTVKGMIFFQLTPFHHSSLLWQDNGSVKSHNLDVKNGRSVTWLECHVMMYNVLAIVDNPPSLTISTQKSPKPCTAIHYTHDGTWEQTSCYELSSLIQTPIIFVWNMGTSQSILSRWETEHPRFRAP